MTPPSKSDAELRKAIGDELDLMALHIGQQRLYTPSAEMHGEIYDRLNVIMPLIQSKQLEMLDRLEDTLENTPLAYAKDAGDERNAWNCISVSDALQQERTNLEKQVKGEKANG